MADCPAVSGAVLTAGNNCNYEVVSGGKTFTGTCDRGGVVRDWGTTNLEGGDVKRAGGLLQLRGNRPGTMLQGFSMDVGFKTGSWDTMPGFSYDLASGTGKLTELQFVFSSTYSDTGVSTGCHVNYEGGSGHTAQAFTMRVDSTMEVCRVRTGSNEKQRLFLVHGSIKCTGKNGDQVTITL